jgi:hypothetical protein
MRFAFMRPRRRGPAGRFAGYPFRFFGSPHPARFVRRSLRRGSSCHCRSEPG